MFSHDEIWLAIDRLAAAHGYSASGLSKKAGLDPTTFNKSKRISADGKPRWPSTESISKILAVTGANMSELLSLTGGGAPETLPLLALDEAGAKGRFDKNGHPSGAGWDEVPFAAAPGTFALQVSDGSMEPHYSKGDVLIVSPGTEARRGDRVVVKMAEGPVITRILTRKAASSIDLQPFDSSRAGETLGRDQIEWLAKIIWASQ